MKKSKIIAILMIIFGVILIGGSFVLGNDSSEEQLESDSNEGVYYDPADPDSTRINLLEQMQKLEYKYKEISVTMAYIYANPGINIFDGIIVYRGKDTLLNFKFLCVLYDKNDKEIYRFRTEGEILEPGEEIILRAETMTYLGDVVRFEIIY